MMLHKDCQTKWWQIQSTDRQTGDETEKKKIENIATFLQLMRKIKIARNMKLKLRSVRRRDRREHSKYENRRRPAAQTHTLPFLFLFGIFVLSLEWTFNVCSFYKYEPTMDDVRSVPCFGSSSIFLLSFPLFVEYARTFAHWLSMALALALCRSPKRASKRLEHPTHNALHTAKDRNNF